MTKFRTTEQILSSTWKFENVNFVVNPNPEYWTKENAMTIEDVNTWEEIEFVPGCFGIYVSWDPYAEFYLVTFNQFLNESQGLKVFSGKDASSAVINFAKKLGCDLKSNKILINN
jgi:hypothetical protein